MTRNGTGLNSRRRGSSGSGAKGGKSSVMRARIAGRKAAATAPRSLGLELPRRLLALEVRDHGLARDRHLVEADEDLGRERQVDIDARSEPDQAEALPGREIVALA